MSIITLNNNSLSGVTALPAGVGGKVLQVVTLAKTNSFSTTSSSFVDITGFTLNITPSSTSSKILVMVSAQLRVTTAEVVVNSYAYFQVLRNGTIILDGYPIIGAKSSSTDIRGSVGFSYLDSPSSTSTLTYKGRLSATYTETVHINASTNPSTITLMEIAG